METLSFLLYIDATVCLVAMIYLTVDVYLFKGCERVNFLSKALFQMCRDSGVLLIQTILIHYEYCQGVYTLGIFCV